jgi:polygalacturonase
MIDVRDFNAIGDGISDDTQPIINAINASNTENDFLFIPKNFNCKIILPSSQLLKLPNKGIFGG